MTDWISQLPKGWAQARLKSVVESVLTGVWGEDPRGDADDILCVRVADFNRPKYAIGNVATLRSVSPRDRALRALKAGDILLEKSGGTPANPVGYTVMFSGGYEAVTSNFVARVRFSSGHWPRFWLYALAASYATGRTQRCVRQTTGIQNLDMAWFFSESFPIPPTPQQIRIASFLDRETAQIDTLIAKQERLIETLRERRQASIDDAFKIAKSNDLAQLRRAIDFLTSGSRGWGEYYADEGDRFVRIGNLPRATLTLRGDVQHVNLPPDVTEGERTRLKTGDLLFSITAYLGSIAVVDSTWAEGYVSQHVALCRLDTNRLDPVYVGYYMLSTDGQHQLKQGAYGGTKVQLALEDLRTLTVPMLSMETQRAIVSRLDREVLKIDNLIRQVEQFIALAKERRAALITAAVTGQIDVSKAA